MNILALESAALAASAALLSGNRIIAEYTTNFRKTHSETLLPMVEEILRMTGFKVEDIDAFAVSEGPGSFTGLRIGAATVKGLAFAAEKPVIPVPTLAAMAYQLYGAGDLIAPIMDARRDQVYTALYEFSEGAFRCLREASAESIAEQMAQALRFSEASGKRVLYLGDGVPVFRDTIEKTLGDRAFFVPAHLAAQRAAAVAVLGEKLFQEGKAVSAFDFSPVYLRKSQAEREREAMGLPLE